MVRAQQSGATASSAGSAANSSDSAWQNVNWLQASDDQQRLAASGTSFSSSSGQDIKDPTSVLTSGSLWQEKAGFTCSQRLEDALTLSYETSAVTPTSGGADPFQLAAGATSGEFGASDDLYRGQKATLLCQPVDALTLGGNVHTSSSDFSNPGAYTVTSGAGFSAAGKLPMNSTLTLDLNSDRTGTDLVTGGAAHDTTWDAQYQQPITGVPLTAVLKGRYEQITDTGSPASRMPSMEQSLVWKPVQDTTLQMGLRQQQYEEYPGITDQFNQALFADWSQAIMTNVSWHSYAEMMNSKSLEAITTSNTPQATAPGSNPALNASVPVSLDTETLTFTTGPAFKLQDDLSASIEYSSRWDKNPQPGDLGEEQRISVSLKGTF